MGIVNQNGALILATGIDNSGLNSGLSDAEKRINSFGQTAQETGRSLNSALDISQMVELQKKVISDLEKQYTELKNTLDTGTFKPGSEAELEKQKIVLSEINKQLQEQKSNLGLIESAQKMVTQAIDFKPQSVNAYKGNLEELSILIDAQRKKVNLLVEDQVNAANRLSDAQFRFENPNLKGVEPISAQDLAEAKASFEQINKSLKENDSVLKILDQSYKEAFGNISANAGKVENSISRINKGLQSDAVRLNAKEIEASLSSLDEKFSKIKSNSGVISNKSIEEQRAYLFELDKLRKELSSLESYTRQERGTNDELNKSYENSSRALKEIQKEIKLVVSSIDNASKSSTASTASYLTQMQKIRQEMQALKLAGQSESQRYRELTTELERVGTAYTTVRREQRLLTTAGNAQLAGMIQGITGVAGAFSAAQGVASLFVKNNEQLAAIQTKLQAAMAITMGLQQISNTLHATSSFRIVTVAKATRLWRESIVVLNRQLGLSVALSKGLMIGGIGLLLVGIAALVSRYKEYNKEQKEFRKLSSDAKASIQEQVSKLQTLERVLHDSNRTYSERKNALDQLKSIMPEYNATLDKEGKLIKDNTGALKEYVKQLLNVEMAKSTIKKLADAETDLREFKDGLTARDKSQLEAPADGEWIEHNGKKYKTNGDDERARRVRKQNDKLQSEVNRYTSLAEEYVTADAKVIAKEGTKEFYEQKQKSALALLSAMKDTKKGSKEWNDALAEYKQAASKLKQWDFSGNTKTKNEDSTAKKLLDTQLWLANKQKELSNEQIKFELDQEQRKLDLKEDGFEKQKQQNELNHRKELLSAKEFEEKKLKEQQEIAKRLYTEEHKGSDKGFDFSKYSSDDLSKMMPEGLRPEDIQKQVEALNDVANGVYAKADFDLLKTLLEKYQDYNAKRFSVDKEYKKNLEELSKELVLDPNNEAIKSAIVQLNKDWQKAISDIDLNELTESIDWQHVFGDLDKVSAESIEKLNKQLEDYVQRANGKIDPTNLKTLEDAIDKLNKKYAELKPNKAFTDGFKEYKEATEKVKKLREQLQDIQNGKEVVSYLKYDPKTNTNIPVLKKEEEVTKDLNDALDEQATAREKLGGSIVAYAGKMQQILAIGNELTSTFEDLGIDVSESAKQALDGLGKFADGAMQIGEGIASKNPIAIIQGSIKAVGGLAKTVGALFGGESKDNKRYQEMVERYDSLNKVWDQLISKKKEYLSMSYGEEARKVGEEAKRLTEKQIDANREMGKAFFDSSKNKGGTSWGRRQRDRIDANDWKDLESWKQKNNISDDLYKSATTSGMKGLFDLSSEQLQSLKEEAPTLWAKLEDKTKEYLDNIIAGGEALEDINKSLKEQYTQISLDSFKDNYVDMLLDMDSSNQDLADNFEKYIQKAILSSLIGSKYKAQIESLYDDFANANSDGNIDETEMAILKKKQDDLAAQMIAERDKLKDTFGWESDSSKSQSASKGGFETMSQDQASALEGRFTGLQMSGIKLEEYSLQLIFLASENNNVIKTLPSTFQEFRNIFLAMMYDLQDMKKSNNELYEINRGIKDMSSKLDRL